MAFRRYAPGSMAAHDELALVFARHLLAESAFDAAYTPETALAADEAWGAVLLATRIANDDSPVVGDVRAWAERRLATYRDLMGGAA